MDVGKKIKELREKAGMTLEELAEKAGMDPERVCSVEDYLGSLCSFETAEQIFQALDYELRAVWPGGGWMKSRQRLARLMSAWLFFQVIAEGVRGALRFFIGVPV